MLRIDLSVHRIAALATVVILSACQSNGLTPQQGTGFQPTVAPAKTAARPQSKVNLYSVTELATLGGDYSVGTGINNRGWIAGNAATASDAAQHAVLWTSGGITDFGTLGGPNSVAEYNVSSPGVVAGWSDTTTIDPYSENWCGDQYTCQPFYWRAGKLHTLPTLGGNNAHAAFTNSAGEIAGYAETATQDPNCLPPQVFDWEAARWDRSGHATQLAPLSGDVVSAAVGINDPGDVVGASGPVCAPVSLAFAVHAVLWPRHGSPISLPTLGGAYGNLGNAINNHGDIAGCADVPGDTATHAVLWKKGYNKVIDLGTLPGYPFAFSYAINSKDQIVGTASDAYGNVEGFLWENGTMYDLSSLIPPSSNLDVVQGRGINDAGVITGEVCDPTSCPAFKATPNGHMGAPAKHQKFVLTERVRERLMRELLPFGFKPIHR